jgi:uncharacterized protein (DUF58 family)
MTALLFLRASVQTGSLPGVRVQLADLVRLRGHTRGFSFLPRQPVHSLLSGRHASHLRGRGLNFEEIRRYLPGDDIRNMDWHVTARTQKPHVRVYTEERDRSVILVVDQRAGMFFGSKRAMKSVVAAEAAALAAWRVLAGGDRVGAVVFDDYESVVLKPQRSEARVLQLLATLVKKNAALRAGPAGTADRTARLNDALIRAARLVPHDGLFCLITDAEGADESTRRITSGIVEHNDAMLILVHDPLEAGLPAAGPLVFSDGAGQLAINSSDRDLSRRFSADHAARRAKLTDLSRRRAVPVLPIDTEAPVADQLRRLIGIAADARTRGVA